MTSSDDTFRTQQLLPPTQEEYQDSLEFGPHRRCCSRYWVILTFLLCISFAFSLTIFSLNIRGFVKYVETAVNTTISPFPPTIHDPCTWPAYMNQSLSASSTPCQNSTEFPFYYCPSSDFECHRRDLAVYCVLKPNLPGSENCYPFKERHSVLQCLSQIRDDQPYIDFNNKLDSQWKSDYPRGLFIATLIFSVLTMLTDGFILTRIPRAMAHDRKVPPYKAVFGIHHQGGHTVFP